MQKIFKGSKEEWDIQGTSHATITRYSTDLDAELTYQEDEFESHRHNSYAPVNNLHISSTGTRACKDAINYNGTVTWNMTMVNGDISDYETRPVNVYVMFIIKY